MLIKTSDLIGDALNWVAAKADGHDEGWLHRQMENPYPSSRGIPALSTSWALAGPIIEREMIEVSPDQYPDYWYSTINREGVCFNEQGPTPLIAAMRCLIASKLGDEIEIPDAFMESP